MRLGHSLVLIALALALLAPCSATVTSIADAKLAADATPVSITGAIVTAVAPDAFYVEADSRSCAIRVDKAAHGLDGQWRANITGTMQTDAENGERYIAATTAVRNGTGTADVRTIAMSNKDLGGSDLRSTVPGGGQKGVLGGIGPNNIGLFVRTRGRITYGGADFYYIDDGSHVQDGSGHVGVRVAGDPGLCAGMDPVGWYMEVSGISSCYKEGNDLHPLLLATSAAYKNDVTTSSGLTYLDLREGTGATATWGKTVSVDYKLWLTNCQLTDSSEGRGPFQFALGSGGAIPGFQEGVYGMKVGGKRFLIVPYQLGYGEEGAPPLIPPYATLFFEVELLSVQ